MAVPNPEERPIPGQIPRAVRRLQSAVQVQAKTGLRTEQHIVAALAREVAAPARSVCAPARSDCRTAFPDRHAGGRDTVAPLPAEFRTPGQKRRESPWKRRQQ